MELFTANQSQVEGLWRSGDKQVSFLFFDGHHAPVPFADLFVARGQFVMAGIKKIFQHPEQVEIHKARLVIQQKILVQSK